MAEVRSDSMICIQDKTGKLRTVILEGDYESGGYKANGWTVVKDDWTKDREVRGPVDFTKEMSMEKLGRTGIGQ